ncbi:MAG: hypothetical protein PVG93_00535, partial [Phycisphaerales bacterium]
MYLKWQKFRLWFISLIAIFAIYLLYSQFSKTPKIPVRRNELQLTDADEQDPNKTVAKVGDVGIGTLEMARFTTLNPRTKQVEREFGFERLLHEEGQQWEIEKPYMNIYRPDLKCYVTAERGFVVLESEVSPPNPKDATLTGNVVAHIVPEPGSDIEESFIYLDDLLFVSEKSEFSTAGPVRFVSRSANFAGVGLKLVYDDDRDRLALLRIKEVEDLRIKVSKEYSLTSKDRTSDSTSKTPTAAKTPASAESSAETVKTAKDVQTYKCIIDGNVTVETNEEVIAASRISISDILWSDRGSEKIEEAEPAQTQTAQPDSTYTAPSVSEQQIMEVTVKCDNGIAVAPTDSLGILKTLAHLELEPKKSFDVSAPLNDTKGRTVFAAQQIDYSAQSTDAVAQGLSKLKFYVGDVVDETATETAIPVFVTSKTKARFAPKSDQIVFEGGCVCSMTRRADGFNEHYTLAAPTLLVDVAETSSSKADISYLTAVGTGNALAKLASVKKDKQNFLGGIELKCPRFEYDPTRQLFVATGPGVIKADNSKIPLPEKRVGRFSLRRPCYAVVRNFETLQYDLETEQITAYSDTERILIDYFLIGEEGSEQVSVTAGRIEADLVETQTGQKRLWALLATNGISYRDRDKLFEGSALFYDDHSSIIKARGDDSM